MKANWEGFHLVSVSRWVTSGKLGRKKKKKNTSKCHVLSQLCLQYIIKYFNIVNHVVIHYYT